MMTEPSAETSNPAPRRTLLDRVVLLKRKPKGFDEIGMAWAKVRHSSSKAGNSHTIIVRHRTDIETGDHCVFQGVHLEVVGCEDFNGSRQFLKIDADAVKAKATRRLISRLSSEGE